METIYEEKGKAIIRKYSKYYVRFMGGAWSPMPCDVPISAEQKEAVIRKSITVEELLRKRWEVLPHGMEDYYRSGFSDFFEHKHPVGKAEFQRIMQVLSKEQSFRNEMYDAIMYEKFPRICMAKVHGKTAKEYSKELGLGVNGTYLHMLKELMK